MSEHYLSPEETIVLPKPQIDLDVPLMTALKNRKSERDFNTVPLTAQEISNMLWAACGINRDSNKLTAPLLWDLYTYVALPFGTYLYEAKQHQLKKVNDENLIEKIRYQNYIKKASAILIFAVDLADMTNQWVDESGGKLFYAGNQTAYVSQNVYLAATAMDIKTVAISWFDHILFDSQLGFTGSKHAYLLHPLGK